jgi:hypothetical protein
MRARERWYFVVIGLACCLGVEAGLWLLPLVAFAMLEACYTVAERRRPQPAPVRQLHRPAAAPERFRRAA